MSTPQRVQAYLERHKVGLLFEELMSSLIHDQPQDPVLYLIKRLQKKHKQQEASRGISPVRKSTSDLISQHRDPDASPEITRKSLPASAWGASSDGALAVAKKHGYEKPWLTNSKRGKKKPQDDGDNQRPVLSVSKMKLSPRETTGKMTRSYSAPSTPRKLMSEQTFEEFVSHKKVTAPKQPKPEWNPDKKVPSADFDALWELTGGGKAYHGSRPSEEAPSKKKAGVTWASGKYMDDEDLLFTSPGYTGPSRHVAQTEEEELAVELALGKSKRGKRDMKEETQGGIGTASSKKKGFKQDAEKHRKELEKLVTKQQEERDSGYQDSPGEDEYDEAVEVLENVDELRAEGAKVKASGVKISKSAQKQDSAAQVRVSICARCARVIGGGLSEPQPSKAAPGKYGQLHVPDPDAQSDVGSRVSTAVKSKSSSSSSEADADEEDNDTEFESVSQVSGPRHPVWNQEESDAETLTPRKGNHMFSPRISPNKGRPMYGRPSTSETREKRPSGSLKNGQTYRKKGLSASLPMSKREYDTDEERLRSSMAAIALGGDRIPGDRGSGDLSRSMDLDSQRGTPAGLRASSNFSEGEESRPPSSGSNLRGQTWQIPEDSDVGSTVDWTRSRPSKGKKLPRDKVAY